MSTTRLSKIEHLNEVPTVYIQECFTYDPVSGQLYWSRTRPKSHYTQDSLYKRYVTKYSGKVAGSKNAAGYIRIWFTYDGKTYSAGAHYLVWRFFGREQPPDMDIDHINGERDCNLIDNLRLATRRQNCRNRRVATNNRTGVTGVYFDKSSGQWRAAISAENSTQLVASFDSLEDAVEWRKEMEKLVYGEFVRNNDH